MKILQSEELLKTKLILDEFSQLVLVIDKNNNVVLANDYAQKVLGLNLGSTQEQINQIFGIEDLYSYVSNLTFNYQWHGSLIVNTHNRSDEVLWVKTKFIPGQKCVFHDLLMLGQITTVERPEHNLQDRSWNVDQAQFRKLCEISSTINSSLDFQGICEEITMKAAELIRADRSLLYSVNNMQIGVFAVWNMTEEEKKLFRLVDMEHGVIKNCLRNMAPVLVPYYTQHPDWIPEIYEALNFESFILYPLLAQKQLVGVLALFGKEPLKFDDQDLMLLQMISNQMAIAVLNAQVHSEIRNLNKHLEEEVCLKINELRISELQLIRKHNELEAVFHSITDILVVVDDNLRILDINKAAQNYYSITDKRKVIGKIYCEVLCEQQTCKKSKIKDKECYEQCCSDCYLQDTLSSGQPIMTEVYIGNFVYMISVYPIFDETGKVVKVICFLRDITLTKRKSEELIQHQKMQAVGQLAAGVAHEIRNPLGAISNYVYILEDWLQELEYNKVSIDNDIKNTFKSIKKLVERSENVIRNLLDFSRGKSSEVTLFKVCDVIDQIMMLVGKTAQRKNVKIIINGDPNLEIKTDSNALQHILFNLFVNAIDAMPDGGEISMDYELNTEWFIFSVVDNGMGISKEDVEKIFNPFYTTKAPDRGTGLGLYVVYNLVQQLKGSIFVESLPSVGTTFNVKIPHDSR